MDRVTGDTLPDFAPEALRDIEDLLPQPQDWSLDGEGYLNMGSNYGSYYSGLSLGHRGHNLSDEEARLYIYDDLGVSQRWANKFSEAGIETVADLVGHTEEDLLRIEGIGVKAIEELKEGLAERDLSHVIEDDLAATNDDMSQLLDMVFSPDDTILIGGDGAAHVRHVGRGHAGRGASAAFVPAQPGRARRPSGLGRFVRLRPDQPRARGNRRLRGVGVRGARYGAPLFDARAAGR